MTDSVVIVNMRHIRKCKMCSAGTRDFFRTHDMDWQTFITVGLPAEVFEATNDALAIMVAKAARDERRI